MSAIHIVAILGIVAVFGAFMGTLAAVERQTSAGWK